MNLLMASASYFSLIGQNDVSIIMVNIGTINVYILGILPK
jgi:hypothetical protein